ncbi:hypothetical protein ACQP2E_37845 [Actinoplanes sp. CA-015351]|uniref:hypothetical protein n=1 Tax=Actinoplanes sp. CA-015351 TaxID=3239897 RepID=UPI003D97535B
MADGLEIDRRLCRVGDLSLDELTLEAMPSADDGATVLRDLLGRAKRLNDAGLTLLGDQLNQIRKVDRSLGSQVTDLQLLAYMGTLAELRSFSLLPGRRERLADLFCDAAALAGWVALDLGDVAASWRHHESAKEAGRETGSPIALTHALAQQAYVLLDIGDTVQAVQLAEYALTVADRAVPAVLLAWLWAVLGEMQAIIGADQLSRNASERAERLLPANPADPAVPYIMLNEFHLARWRGAAFARLGDESAIDEMHFALTGTDSSWARAKAQLHVDLAYSLVTAKHEDQAVRQLDHARDLAIGIGSRRQKRRIRDLELLLQQTR